MDRGEAGSTSLDKAIDLLFHLSAQARPCGVTEVGGALGLPKSSAHRLLSTLARRGLLERDARGRYCPGSGLIALGLGALEREPVAAAARPVLEEEAEALGEAVFLTAPRAGAVVVLDKVDGRGFLRAAPGIGEQVPLHGTAVGRVVLAFGPDAVRSAGAVPGSEALVAAVRSRGYAESHGEWIEGLSVVAVPVRGPAGDAARLVAALAAAAPTPRLAALGVPWVARRLVAAAGRIEARMRVPVPGGERGGRAE